MLQARRTSWGSGWTAQTATEAAQRWAFYVRTIQKDLPRFERTRTVRYEDLSARGPEVLADLFDGLGVPLGRAEVQAICRRWDFPA